MTRARINFIEEEEVIATAYVHSDGMIESLGRELSEQFGEWRYTNGFNLKQSSSKVYNGMGDLAAWWFRLNKTSAGGVYLTSTKEDEHTRIMIDYHYFLKTTAEGELWLTVFTFDNKIPEYDGKLEGLLEELKNEK